MKQLVCDRLTNFIGAYFHEDWDADDPDAISVVERYIRDTGDHAELRRVADELAHVLAKTEDTQALERLFYEELGLYYDPAEDGVTLRAWLESVVHRLRETRS